MRVALPSILLLLGAALNGADPVAVTIQGGKTINPAFIGLGFHAFYPVHHQTHSIDQRMRDEVLWKRWGEMRPSFVRVTHAMKTAADGTVSSSSTFVTNAAQDLSFMASQGADIYVTSWHPPLTATGSAQRTSLIDTVANDLTFWRQQSGGERIRWYCWANEMSVAGKPWAYMSTQIVSWVEHHQQIRTALDARGQQTLGLLATDAGSSKWNTIENAASKDPDLHTALGGHDYEDLESVGLNDPAMLGRVLGFWKTNVGRSKSRNLPWIMGEFGIKAKNPEPQIGNKTVSQSLGFDDPAEPLVAINLVEMAMAGMQAGVAALGSWSFADFPDEYPSSRYFRFGTFRWGGTGDIHARDFSTRAHYAPMGWMAREMRGPGRIVQVAVSEPLVRAAALLRTDGHAAAVLTNRSAMTQTVQISGLPAAKPLRVYVYDPAAVPACPFGDLPSARDLPAPSAGPVLVDLPANGVAILTTQFDVLPPGPVVGLTVADGVLNWPASPEADLCYYRIYRQGTQIGSTRATSFIVGAGVAADFRVVAVDQSLNALAIDRDRDIRLNVVPAPSVPHEVLCDDTQVEPLTTDGVCFEDLATAADHLLRLVAVPQAAL